jgi:hypothetical protein
MENLIGRIKNRIIEIIDHPSPATTCIGRVGFKGLIGVFVGSVFQSYGDCYNSGKFENLPFGFSDYFTPLESEEPSIIA